MSFTRIVKNFNLSIVLISIVIKGKFMKALPVGHQVALGKIIQVEESKFRQTEPIDIWGGNVLLQNVEKEEFIDKLIQLSNGLKLSFPGYFIYKENSSPIYHISRYSRKQYGPPPEIERCRDALERIGSEFNISVEEEQVQMSQKFRTVLGLREGYEQGSYTRSIEEVKRELKEGFDLEKGEICTIRNGGCYREEAVVITGDIDKIQKVFLLAEKFLQERFSVEDFSSNLTYMLETKHCKEPDK